LGFKETGHTINYWWGNNVNRFNRNSFMKHKLVKSGEDKNKTEDQIMKEHGFRKIFGVGNLKYEFIN
jgi:hypothetical protein